MHVYCVMKSFQPGKEDRPTSPLPPDGEDWELLSELDGGSPSH